MNRSVLFIASDTGERMAGPGIRTWELFGALWHDVERAGIADCVHFLGHRDDPDTYVAGFDVFALTSREDPYPLVCLEAASFAKPVVCFDGSGGAKEFVEEDSGFVVPYMHIEMMADPVLAFLASAELRQRLGSRAREKVRERHDVSMTAPRIVEIIDRVRRRENRSAQQTAEDAAP